MEDHDAAGRQSGARTVLFLQGPSSPLFSRIADRLEALRIRARRINLCAGDRVFWRRAGATNYRGRLEDWDEFLRGYFERERVTEIVLLGEERPHHKIAAQLAAERSIPVITIDMGYLRPDWITVELGGSGCNSHFPADPAHILAAAARLPEPDLSVRYRYSFLKDAAYDLLFNLPNVFLWFLYPHYRWHALYHPLAEYAGWLRRLAASRRRAKAATRVSDAVAAGGAPCFVYPLQLETDYQLRIHSPFRNQTEAIVRILGSFAAHAPPPTRLVVKLHPLDNGLVDWRERVQSVASGLGIAERVLFLDGGDLRALLRSAAGMVAVNSSAGLEALRADVPTKVLGVAVYDIEGLTDRQPLDGFWSAPKPPHAALRSAFFRLLAASIQVRGNFYERRGIEAGAAAIAERIALGSVNQPGGYVARPPRERPAKAALNAAGS